MIETPRRVVVLGAGYAGMLAAVRLAGRVKREVRRDQVAITLVNAADVFVERVRLHQVAANQPMTHRPITDILRGTGVGFVQGEVTRIDAARRTIEIQTPNSIAAIGYDYLMYALGSTIDRESVPGVRVHAYTLTPRGPRSAVALREVLSDMSEAGRSGQLLVCGAGATGIEAAAELAEAYPNLRITLATRGAFGQFMSPAIANYMRRTLTRLGVEIRDRVTLTELRAAEALTASDDALPYDICLWAGGFAVPNLARQAQLVVNERGQIAIDPFMRSISHPEIYAVGDAAQPVEIPGAPVRMAAATAVMMGAHGADCLAAALRDRQPRPFSFAYAGQAIALGRRDAIGFNTYPNDRPNRPYVTGAIAARTREVFVRLLASLPGLERRRPGAFIWLGKGRYAAMKRRELRTAALPHQQ